LSDQPLVTIGIVNYNCVKYLETCVETYLNQSYTNMEIILIDDCSTDGSVEILKELEKNNKNIRCIYHEKNSGGPSQGIREIICQAQGRYFQWIASDDYAEVNAIQNLTDYLEKTGNDYAYCNFNIVNENNTVTTRWFYTVPKLNEMACKIFTNCSGVIPMNGLYRLEFFHKNNITWSNYENNEYSGDTINSLYLIENGMKYGLLNECLINYRVHNDNCSHNIEKRIRTSLTVYEYIIKHFNETVYFPNVEWNGHTDREQLKNYTIASFYYSRMMDYLKLEGLPHHIKHSITKEKVLECISTFIEKGLEYIHEGLSQGDTLKEKLIGLEDQYKKISEL
jgi:glycosyltransferase involved in cell wall biosynthesis